MTKWDKILTLSLLVFLAGVFVFLLGEHLVPDWSRGTILVGAWLMSVGGFTAGISGLSVLLGTNART